MLFFLSSYQLVCSGDGSRWRSCLCCRFCKLPCCLHLPQDSHHFHHLKIFRSAFFNMFIFIHVKCKFRLPRAEWDQEGFGKWKSTERVARSQGCSLWCSCICHAFQVSNSRVGKITTLAHYTLLHILFQVHSYTQGQTWVQGKMKEFVDWWPMVAFGGLWNIHPLNKLFSLLTAWLFWIKQYQLHIVDGLIHP